MYNIVLSGGPSSGKSTSLSKLESELTEKLGMKVFTVSEGATELILGGIQPCPNMSLNEFERYVIKKQLEKEAMVREVAEKYYNPDKVVILYDRSLLDCLAYCDRDVFLKLIKEQGLSVASINDRYDLIIHMVTAAKGTDFYTQVNNLARRETKEEAVIADNKTLQANLNHPHIKIIDNEKSFEQKVQNVVETIFEFINSPVVPSEIERKFLIEKPTEDILSNIEFSSKANIIQTYLKSANPDVERRIRQRGTDENGYTFYYTEKQMISEIERSEKESIISAREYISLMNQADTSLHQIHKTRYCFMYKNQFFEMDIYPSEMSDRYSILEIELPSVSADVELPPFINVVKEVTADNKYKNYSLAKTLTLE